MYRNTNDYNFARQKREKKTSKTRYIVALAVFCAVILGFTSRGGEETQNNVASNPVVASEMTTINTIEDHPLQNVQFPGDGTYAVGTLFEGTVKTNQNEDPVPMASITKVITALVVLDKAPLQLGEQGDSITLQAKDEDYYWNYAAVQGTITGVTAGLEMSQYDILQTMLLASSNNMSDTIADHYFGSVEAYVEAANAYLLREGFNNTQVVDATGFAPGSVSTPSELIKLGQLALRNPVIAEISKKQESFVPVAGGVPNYNVLIDEPNVTGLKPGFTDEAGSTLLFSADFPLPNGDTKTVLGVVVGHQNKPRFYLDTVSVLDQMRSLYSN